MNQLSISFTLGKASEANRANIAHNNRCFLAKNIDPKKSGKNIDYKLQSLEDAYQELFSAAIEEYNAAQKIPCRRIRDYLSHISEGKREEAFYEIVVQFGDYKSAFDPRINLPELLDEYMKGFQARNPNLHVFNAVMHLDEVSPHLHIDFVPFYTKGRQRGLRKGVSMRAALLEQGFTPKHSGENQLTRWEASERNEMEAILHRYGLNREDKHAQYSHMTVSEYKAFQDARNMALTLRQMRSVSHSEVTPEVIRKLKMELHAAQQKTDQLEAEKHSPYKCFYYSDDEKREFVQQKIALAEIPFRETDHGFEVPECYVKQIREIEKTYRVPAGSVRSQLRDDIDRMLYQSKDFDGFLARLQTNGFAVKRGKYISVKPPYSERYIRLKSLGEHYDELSLRSRIRAKQRIEERLHAEIEKQMESKTLFLYSLQETKRYMIAFSKDLLPMRKKDQAQPFMWKNDAELDKLLVLNRQLNEGMTPESIRQKAEMLEREAQSEYEKMEAAEKDMQIYLDLKEKISIIFEGKPSERFTQEQARATLKQYPIINATNYFCIENAVKTGQEKLQKHTEAHRKLRDELKKVTDSLSILERVQNRTYVMSLIEKEKLIRQTEVLGNGFATAGMTIG